MTLLLVTTGTHGLNVLDSRFIPAARSGNSQQIPWTKEHALEKVCRRTKLGQNSLSDVSALMKFSTESVYRAGLFSLLFTVGPAAFSWSHWPTRHSSGL